MKRYLKSYFKSGQSVSDRLSSSLDTRVSDRWFNQAISSNTVPNCKTNQKI